MNSQSELISKFSNIYIMLLYSIMTNNMSRVKHFLSDDLYEYYSKIVDTNKTNNETHMYDELNVSQIELLDKKIDNEKEVITVKIFSKYMDYFIDNKTGNYKRGVNDHRIEKENLLVFEKSITAKKREIAFSCPSCGANLDINFTGVCPFCNNSVDLEEYDYILTKLEVI